MIVGTLLNYLLPLTFAPLKKFLIDSKHREGMQIQFFRISIIRSIGPAHASYAM